MTTAEKDLCLSSLEWTLAYAKYRLGIDSLATIEHMITHLQALYTNTPDNVTWPYLAYVYGMLKGWQVNSARVLTYSTWLAKVTAADTSSGSGLFDGSATFNGALTFSGA